VSTVKSPVRSKAVVVPNLPVSAVESFEHYRSYLFAIAYRMLGSAMDAEDMVQETFLRYQQAASSETIVSLKAYLTTILTRLCIGQLALAYRQREEYMGPWLPEPITTAADPASTEEQVDTYEAVSLAFLILLEELQPVERAVFLLREVFDYDYPEIADFLGKSEDACRQWLSRAKKHLAGHENRFPASPETHRQMLTNFHQVVQAGNMDALMEMLAEDVTFWVDSGGSTRGAATRPMAGRDDIAAFVMRSGRFLPQDRAVEFGEVNGQPAMIVRAEGHAIVVLTLEIEGQQIKAIRAIANPAKLARV
jgi:RNA polymerase sigma-70 factor, ECF subfamily